MYRTCFFIICHKAYWKRVKEDQVNMKPIDVTEGENLMLDRYYCCPLKIQHSFCRTWKTDEYLKDQKYSGHFKKRKKDEEVLLC